MEAPTFSVVVPAYNAADTIEAAIRSVLAQTRPDFELIVVDDGSSDGTAEIVEGIATDERIRFIRQQNNGAAAARNVAVEQSRGRYVSFLDSDDLWLPRYLEAMGSSLEQAPASGFAYTDAWTLDPLTGRIGRATAMAWQRPPVRPPDSAEALVLELLERNFVYSATTVRRDVFEHVGLFDASLQAAIDYEMWLRIAANGSTAVRPPGLLAVYRRMRPGSISSNRARVYASLVRVYDHVADDLPVSAAARELARKRAAFARAELKALEGSGGLDATWRTRVRPRLVGLKNALLRRDTWLAMPPSEVATAFPELVSGSAPRAEPTPARSEKPNSTPS